MSGPIEVGIPGGTTTFGSAAARPETLADRRAFLTDGLTPVACRSCGTAVLVRKNSPQHTSIQWTSDPAASCPVFAAHVAAGKLSATLNTCPRLVESIAHAARAGRVRARTTTAPTETEEDES